MVTAGYRLGEGERAQLVALRQLPGFQILLNLMEAEVSKFAENLINTKAGQESEILANHYLAKAAAQFYQGLVNSLNNELETFANHSNVTQIQPDVTEALFSE